MLIAPLHSIRFVLTGLLFLLFLFGCNEEDNILPQDQHSDSLRVKTMSTASFSCSSCTYIIPSTATVVDGKTLGIRPGDVICLSSSIKYTNSITFRHIVGTSDKPVIITNCGGTVVLTVSGRPINMKASYSKYFRITGGNVDGVYGIKMSGSSSNGLVLCDLSTNFEIDHLEISNVGFAGIMAKTDPTCDDATNRGFFTMKKISIHDNYVHHTGGEGLYVGHSFYNGYTLSCGVKLPHTIEGAKIYRNKITFAGWDGIQVGCATKDTKIYSNTVEHYATAKKANQDYGIIISAGTAGRCYNNYVNNGFGNSIGVFGHGDNIIYNNVLLNAGNTGIFCDERTETFGIGYHVLNNTIINPREVGIRIYSEKVPKNVVNNNIIVNPGSFATRGTSAYIMKLSNVTNMETSNNLTTLKIGDVRFVDPAANNYRIRSSSPAREAGKSISSYSISKDFYDGGRLKGTYVDIGADEY